MALAWFGAKQESLGELIARKKYGRALDVLRAQFRGGARDPHLRMQLADVLVLAGRAKEAAPILAGLADEYAREGFAAKAIAVLKKLQKVAPGHPEVEGRLAELLHARMGARMAAPAAAPAAAPDAAGGLEIGMEEFGIGEALLAGSPPAAELAASAPAEREGAAFEEEFFDTLQDIVEAGQSPAIEGAAAGAPAEAQGGEGRPAAGGIPLFADCSEEELRSIIARLELVSFEPGDIVVTEGQPGDSLFVLTTGTLRAFVRDQAGRNVPVRDMSEGSFFGEIALLRGQPRSATVTCATRCELLELDRGSLDEITAVYPRVRQVIVDTCEARVGSLEEMLARDGWDGPLAAPQAGTARETPSS
jgi:CRP-like cAMP-binding protein